MAYVLLALGINTQNVKIYGAIFSAKLNNSKDRLNNALACPFLLMTIVRDYELKIYL